MESSNPSGSALGNSEVVLQKYLVANITYPTVKNRMDSSNAAETLVKANTLSGKIAFNWQEIKNPKGGQVFLVFMSSKLDETPPDDLIWKHTETSNVINLNDGRVLTVYEKFEGKSPTDPNINITRRRYFLDNKNPSQIQLLHYVNLADDKTAPTSGSSQSSSQASSQNIPYQPQQSQPIRPYMQPSQDYSSNRTNMAIESSNFTRANNLNQSVEQAPSFNNYPQGGMSNLTSKSAPKRKMPKQNQPSRGPREIIPTIAVTGMNPTPAPTHGDDIDLIAARDVALFRYKRNHDHLAELFSHKTQKAITKMRAPLMTPSTLSFFKQRKEENMAEIKRLKLENGFVNLNPLLNEQIEAIKKASSSSDLSVSRSLIEDKFGPLIDRRQLFRPVPDLSDFNFSSEEPSSFMSL